MSSPTEQIYVGAKWSEAPFNLRVPVSLITHPYHIAQNRPKQQCGYQSRYCLAESTFFPLPIATAQNLLPAPTQNRTGCRPPSPQLQLLCFVMAAHFRDMAAQDQKPQHIGSAPHQQAHTKPPAQRETSHINMAITTQSAGHFHCWTCRCLASPLGH